MKAGNAPRTPEVLEAEDARALSAVRKTRRSEKIGSIINAETIVYELSQFLERHYRYDRTGTVLDLGAGPAPYRPIYERYFAQVTTTDVPASPHDIGAVDVIASAESLPFDDGSFDAVICTEVVEHCRDPRAAVREIARVLRPGGHAFVTTPLMVQLHEMPHDYYRFTPSALEDLATSAGCRISSLTPRGDYIAVAIGILGFPISKLFEKLSRFARVNLRTAANPFVFVTLVLPQRLYFASWRLAREGRFRAFARLHRKLSYFALGYVMVMGPDPENDGRNVPGVAEVQEATR